MSPTMVAFHQAAAIEFGLPTGSYRETANFLATKPKASALLAQNGDAYRVALRAMYEHTQDEFRKAGITRVSLHRGYGYRNNSVDMPDAFKQYDKGDTFTYQNQALPLQSWASGKAAAKGFGAGKSWGYITNTSIPVENVLSGGTTGFGTGTGEKEFVLLAGMGEVNHEVLDRPVKSYYNN